MKQAFLKRGVENEFQTEGKLYFSGGGRIISLDTIELPWKGNARNISCIPKGTYLVKTTFSRKYKRWMWEITGVPNRSGVRIHSGNYYFDIEGCILLGLKLRDINGDGYRDTAHSRRAMTVARKYLGREFMLTIS